MNETVKTILLMSIVLVVGCHDRVASGPVPVESRDRSDFFHDVDHEIKTWERLRAEGRRGESIKQGHRIGQVVRANRETFNDALVSPNTSIQAVAAAAVGFTGDEGFNGGLERCLRSSDPRVVAGALTSYGVLRYPFVDTRRVAGFFKWEDPAVRSAAAYCLGRAVKGEADRFVMNALILGATDPAMEVRLSSLTALGDLLAEPAIRVLADRLLADPVEEVRQAAARSLGRIGGDDAVGALMAGLEKEPVEIVRKEISDALQAATGRRFGRDEKAWWRWWNERLGS